MAFVTRAANESYCFRMSHGCWDANTRRLRLGVSIPASAAARRAPPLPAQPPEDLLVPSQRSHSPPLTVTPLTCVGTPLTYSIVLPSSNSTRTPSVDSSPTPEPTGSVKCPWLAPLADMPTRLAV